MLDNLKLDTALMDYLRLSAPFEMRPDGVSNDELKQRVVSKWMQYRGYDWDGVFYGHALIDFRNYWMAQVSGLRSNEVWSTLPREAIPKRIDLQVTRKGDWRQITKIADQLRMADWRGRRRQVRTITNDAYDDTCYVGARTGGVFIRIYAKGDPVNMAIRFEVEFKKNAAAGIWESLWDGIPMGNLLTQAIWQLPKVHGLNTFFEWAAEWEKFQVQEIKTVPTKRKWIENTVIPALWKAANEHDDCRWLKVELLAILEQINRNLDI